MLLRSFGLSCICVIASTTTIPAQSIKQADSKSVLCTSDYAVDSIRQQIAFTRTFADPVQRISALIRAADLLWPKRQETALAGFMEALELAKQHFRENGDEPSRDPTARNSLGFIMSVPDQRFRVIAALAKRDPQAARKLTDKILSEDLEASNNTPNPTRTTDKLLTLASGLVPTDAAAAIAIARTSFRYPATLQLPLFLYTLAKTNETLADQFYQEALNNYSNAPLDQFLYLSSYPFGNNKEAGQMPSYTIYTIPIGFSPNLALQRLFTERLIARTRMALESVPTEARQGGYSDLQQGWLALTRLQKQIHVSLPDLAPTVSELKDNAYALLNASFQRQAKSALALDSPPKRSLDEQVEVAEKLSDVDRRDQTLVFAVLRVDATEPTERVVNVIDKISDADIRASLTNWFFLYRAQALVNQKKLDEARAAAGRVSNLDGRAYLYSRIAEEKLKIAEDQTEAREMLNEIANAAAKAPKTVVTGRALLALANLYAKFDTTRAIEELANAVQLINSLDNPDFSSQHVMMKIEGKTFSSFGVFETPGFNPENGFKEVSKSDFDGTLYQAGTISDKGLRSLVTMAVIEPCLERHENETSNKRKTNQ